VTHDELLAKIGNPVDEGYEYGDIVFNKALCAVVELHKPMDNLVGEFCDTCSDEDIYTLYPCQTIQAIEKELLGE
jgi:hypothetical protein